MKTSGALLAGAALIAALLFLSGNREADPQTPPGLPGKPPPFLGVAVLGDGGLTAAVDSYGNVVDLRPGPAGRALIENPAERQAAGTVVADTGIQVWARVGGEMRPMWRADAVEQSYAPETNVLRTVARFGRKQVEIEMAATGETLALAMGGDMKLDVRVNAEIECRRERDQIVSMLCSRRQPSGDVSAGARIEITRAGGLDRRWLRRARPLGPSAPPWARRMYERSLLVLHALTDRGNGAVAAGARDDWAYVWPRDASAAAIAYVAAGYEPEAKLSTQFLLGLGLEHAARFHGNGSPVPGREAQGDAIGWVAAASQAAGLIGNARHATKILAGGDPIPWRDRADYWEGEPGDYLANALTSGESAIDHLYGGQSRSRLLREPDDPDSGLDSAAAWAVRPFSQPHLYSAARITLRQLVAQGTRFGITPGEGWPGGEDPWSAPTAWTAWSLTALGERREALELMEALRRSATPAGDLPERVDAQTGIPRSTTPLAWSHAFAILALQELWPSRTASPSTPSRSRS